MAAYRFGLNITWSSYSADLLAMLQVLAYKTHAPSGDILTGPQGSGEGDPDACITDACINCNIDRYRRHFLRA